MANNVLKVNGIEVANIAKINGQADADLEKLNGEEYVSAATPVVMQDGLNSTTDTRGSVQIADSGSSGTLSRTIPTGVNNAAFIGIAMHTSRASSNDVVPRFSSIILGGESLTMAAEYGAYNSSGVRTRIEVWALVDPPTGSQTLSYSWQYNGVGWTTGVFAFAMFGEVNQTTPVSSFTALDGIQTRAESNASNTETDGGNSAHSNGGGVLHGFVVQRANTTIFTTIDTPDNEPLAILAYDRSYSGGNAQWQLSERQSDGNDIGGFWAGFQPYGETQTFTHIPATAGYGESWLQWRMVSCAINPV